MGNSGTVSRGMMVFSVIEALRTKDPIGLGIIALVVLIMILIILKIKNE